MRSLAKRKCNNILGFLPIFVYKFGILLYNIEGKREGEDAYGRNIRRKSFNCN